MARYYVLSNQLMERTFEVTPSGISTVSLKDLSSGMEFIHTKVREFAFSVNDVLYNSFTSDEERVVDGNRDQVNMMPVQEEVHESPGEIHFTFRMGQVRVQLFYQLGKDLCAYRKYLKITNISQEKIRLSNLIFDDTSCAPGRFADCEFYAGNAQHPQKVSFCLEGKEDVIRCHNKKLQAGFIMGSTAPGVLHYILCYPHWNNLINGLNMSSAPFAKYLSPGESFTSPSSLFALYQGEKDDPETVRDFRRLVREGLPAFCGKEKLMYCTWIPFLKNITHELTMDLARQASDLGFGYFVLDDGYFTDEDHAVDKEKFHHGLEPLSEFVRAKGMTFGLWLNIGTDYGMKQPDPHFYALRSDGKVNRLGFDYSHAHNIFCFGSAYRESILKDLDALAKRYNVGYFKLDFSHVASPYGLTPQGCHSKEHEFHQGWEDSFSAIYEGMFYLRDEMKKRHPHVILDFSFETFGTETPNIAALELSVLHHVSNSNGKNPDLQDIACLRRNFYTDLATLPAERILHGLLALGNSRSAEYLLTAIAGAPLLAGDLRHLPPDQKKRLALFTQTFNECVSSGPLNEFTLLENKALTDGYLRLNEDKKGFGCFFNASGEEYTFSVPEDLHFTNVENGSISVTVPPGDCALFKVSPAI